jgi:hypothetical protein
MAGWRFHRNFSVIGGYRYLYIDYENGSGSDKYAFDGDIKGPILGLAVHFKGK